MHVVIDTIDREGRCRLMVVEALGSDGISLAVRKGDQTSLIPLANITDWSPIDDFDPLAPSLDRWIVRRLPPASF